jgi:hypothetical protein
LRARDDRVFERVAHRRQLGERHVTAAAGVNVDVGQRREACAIVAAGAGDDVDQLVALAHLGDTDAGSASN